MISRKGQAGEMIPVFAFLCLLVIIGLGIFVSIYFFFGAGYDFRQVDADILNYNIRSCISENILNENFKANIYEICKIDEKVIKDNKYIIRIILDGKEFFKFGDEIQCGLSSKNINYPRCTLLSFNLNNQKIEVLTGSNQQSRGENA